MTRRVLALLDSRHVQWWAAALTLTIGLFFIFVWAPHPWGWAGIDFYHQLSLELARGEAFTTTDVPWGYAYFVAICYRLFGERAWVPLVVQALANATVPLMLYQIVLALADRRTAALSALLVGAFSFNTVYVSTQASDAMCTVIFTASLLCFIRGYQRDSAGYFALSGVLAGLAPQFRPNLLLLPPLMAAALLLLPSRSWRRLGHGSLYLGLMVAMLAPWALRNYRLTGVPIPTSTHGGQQLWYGTLQVGPYLENRALNPRSAFESAAFDYTSLPNQSIVVSADFGPCHAETADHVSLVYWTDRDARRLRVAPTRAGARGLRFELPGQADDTVVYYYFDERIPATPERAAATFVVPWQGDAAPFVAFVSTNHLGDLDRHDDLLDIFDLTRLMRHVAWGDPVPQVRLLDRDANGTLDENDLAVAVATLVPEFRTHGRAVARLTTTTDAATLHLPDGSTLTVPRAFAGRQSDLDPRGEMATALVSRWRTFSELDADPAARPRASCVFVDRVRLNDVFYRHEPHLMNRYTALAFDNISREPMAFAAASLYRIVRLFIIRGSNDVSATTQFSNSSFAYAAGTTLSAGYLLVFLAGTIVAYRQRSALLWLLLPIAYVPLTICFVLTNMRYTITVQPLMFVFVAVALLWVVSGHDRRAPGEPRPRG